MDSNDQSSTGDNNSNHDRAVYLGTIKHKIINELTPLLDNLEMDPIEKFELCINTLRATNETELLDTVLHSATSIPEQGRKAEALLELLTEVKYLSEDQN